MSSRGFAADIRKLGSYSAWMNSWPYLAPRWEATKGYNRYTRSRLEFGRRFLEEPNLDLEDLLMMELYPWHSTSVTAAIRPPAEIIDRFVWQPLAEHPTAFIFAFGKPWLNVCHDLKLRKVVRLGRGGEPLGSKVASKSIAVFEPPSGQWVVVVWQSGYAGPPGGDDALRLREILMAARTI
jgi:hypothetical protein